VIERPISEWVKRNRRATSISGIAYRSDGSCVRVHMTNISYDGCRLLTDQCFDMGEPLTLVMPRMQGMNAQVRWVKDNQAGVVFVQGNALDERRARIGV
jgi:hypothetical protein